MMEEATRIYYNLSRLLVFLWHIYLLYSHSHPTHVLRGL